MKKKREEIIVRHLKTVPVEDAHGGAGKRRLVFSEKDAGGGRLVAATIGYLPEGGIFDWHTHENLDELMIVVKGRVSAESRTQKTLAGPEYLAFFPCNVEHRQVNVGKGEFVAYFIRFKR